jgi:transposase, IS5 family
MCATRRTPGWRGEKITDRLVSIADPDARPIRKGKIGKPNEFGYLAQICEVTENTRPGARGLVLPAATAPGSPGENTLLPTTVAEARAARAAAAGGRARRRLRPPQVRATARPDRSGASASTTRWLCCC